ncbi:MAG: trehalose-phosphatase [Novosphingobium sp.]|nr:trehalose-phosphatase [Novosphingobium sp.]MCP5403499.1 trehalose-phosphatase [Novosphingobium sp.]
MSPTALPSPPSLNDMPNAALFLDFDGTLVEIAPAPDAIVVDPALPALLEGLAEKLEGRLAVVSGRSLADVSRYLGTERIAMAGSHGAELRRPGSTENESLASPIPPDAEIELNRFASTRDGVLVEPKPFSVALHYRLMPEAEGEALALAGSLARALNLNVKRGKMVVELLTPGYDKGSVVAKFMEMPVFGGSRPIFLGDDITDEDAFTKVLEHEGGGVLVGPERDTAARWRLPGVAEVHAWLKAALA